MAIYGYMVTDGHKLPYLHMALQNLYEYTDGIVVVNDRLEPTGGAAVRGYPIHWKTRPAGVPAFKNHEGEFRQYAWTAMEETFQPVEGDWVISIDADERLVPASRRCLDALIARLETEGFDAATFNVREIWEERPTGRYARTDGTWGEQAVTRLVAYRPNGVFADRPMESGSVPETAGGDVYSTAVVPVDEMEIHHYRFAREQDRQAMHRQHANRTSPSTPAYVETLMSPPDLGRVLS